MHLSLCLFELILDTLLEIAQSLERHDLGVGIELDAVRLPLEEEILGGEAVETHNGLELAENIGLKRLVGGEAVLEVCVGHGGRRESNGGDR